MNNITTEHTEHTEKEIEYLPAKHANYTEKRKAMKTKKCFTLVEMLIVIAMLAVFMTAVMGFFHEGSKDCRTALKKADLNSDVIMLRKQWRTFISECTGNFEIREGVLRSGANFAKSEKGTLVLSANGKEKKFVFPENVSFNFITEKDDGLPDSVVVEIKSAEQHKIRIVACEKK